MERRMDYDLITKLKGCWLLNQPPTNIPSDQRTRRWIVRLDGATRPIDRMVVVLCLGECMTRQQVEVGGRQRQLTKCEQRLILGRRLHQHTKVVHLRDHLSQRLTLGVDCF